MKYFKAEKHVSVKQELNIWLTGIGRGSVVN
jgi:hypothetical protein